MSSTEEQIDRFWYTHMMEYYSAIKRNEVLTDESEKHDAK